MTESEFTDLIELLVKFRETYSSEMDDDCVDSIEQTIELVEEISESVADEDPEDYD